jgi:hypothetical protein
MGKMKIYFSGASNRPSLPERLLSEGEPDIMLSYWMIHHRIGPDRARIKRHKERRMKDGDSNTSNGKPANKASKRKS